jgi:hypothetical protein
MPKYYITQEQFEEIQHYKRMFEYDAEEIKDLCGSEKDDIVYGFRLGELHTHLRQCFMDMMELESSIREQEIHQTEKIVHQDEKQTN